MNYYIKKPITIQAWQSPAADELPTLAIAELIDSQGWVVSADGIIIPTLEGDHLAMPGDFIIRGIKGEFYPCEPDIFAATYDKVENPAHEGMPASEMKEQWNANSYN